MEVNYPSMTLAVEEYVLLSGETTFRMGGTARYFAVIESLVELKEAFEYAHHHDVPVIVLGGGSNVIIREDGDIDALVIQIRLKGFEIINEDDDHMDIKIGAGVIWDDAVRESVLLGLSGIEAMSAIPGMTGATVIQNVGAYGQEIRGTLISLEAYEIKTGEIKMFLNTECKFAYRDSIFKNELKGQYVIISITLHLAKKHPEMPEYPGVKKYFESVGVLHPTLLQIRDAIIAIRKVKLPDPEEIASVGSFFKNPFVEKSQYNLLKAKYPNIVAFPLKDGDYKIGAGWIIDTLGLKGKEFGNLMLYPHNALVIVNKGDATYDELRELVLHIQDLVKKEFNIVLEQEPVEI